MMVYELRLICVIIGMTCIASVNSKDAQDNQFDFTMLTMRWPANACDHRDSSCEIPNDVQTFTLHGLWPSRIDGSYPQYCSNEKLHPEDIESIREDLDLHWTNYYTPSKPFGFWKHEYEKHGTCAASIQAMSTPLKFFQEGIRLIEKYDWLPVLAKADIVPSNTKQYTVDSIHDAIRDEFGVSGYIDCEHTKHHKQVLQRAVLCFDNNMKLTECVGLKTQCDSEVYLPLIPHKESLETPAPHAWKTPVISLVVVIVAIACISCAAYIFHRKRTMNRKSYNFDGIATAQTSLIA